MSRQLLAAWVLGTLIVSARNAASRPGEAFPPLLRRIFVAASVLNAADGLVVDVT